MMRKIFCVTYTLIFLCCLSCTTDRSEKQPVKTELKKEKVANNKSKKDEVSSKPEAKSLPSKSLATATLSKTVNINSINYDLISARLLQKVNSERKRLSLPLFKNNNDLTKAAKIHNDYMVRADVLDHSERGTSTPQMRDRINKAGGKFRTAGENIQYEGFTIRTTNGVESILAPTYEALAEQLWQNWKTSPPHYKNITNPDFIYLGTALKWSSKKTAVFATQVYGG